MFNTNIQKNIKSLTIIGSRLEELIDEITFVGGAILGLLITEKGSPDVRFTLDVDCICHVITRADYYFLAEKLKEKGFKELVNGNHPICRWDCDGILVDIMPISTTILGFSNKWYEEAMTNSIFHNISDTINIHIISAPYFLATKLEAFKERGNQDFLLSHDIEDIVSLIDGRPEIANDVSHTSKDLKKYLSNEFSVLLSDKRFLEALPGQLNYSSETFIRQNIVKDRINSIIELGA